MSNLKQLSIRICRIVLLLLTVKFSLAADTIKVKIDFVGNMAEYTTYFVDTCQCIDHVGIYEKFEQQEFRSFNGNLFQHVNNPKYKYWYVFYLKNDTITHAPITINFYNNGLQLDLYELDSNKQLKFLSSGSSHSLPSRLKVPVRSTSLILPLSSNQTKLFFLEAKIIDGNSFYSNPDITTLYDMLFWENPYMLRIGFFVGVFILAFFVNVILGIFLKKKIHFLHASYILFLLLWQLEDYQVDKFFLSESIYKMYTYVPVEFFVLGSSFFLNYVFSIFINQRKQYIRFYNIGNALNILSIVLMFILLLSPWLVLSYSTFYFYLRQVAKFGFALYLIYMLLNLFYGIFRKDKLAILYLLVSIVLFFSYINYLLLEFRISTFSNYYFQEIGNMTIGNCIEIVILTIIFAIQQKFILKENYENQLSLLTMKKDFQEKLFQEQIHERNRIASDLHDLLGTKLATIRLRIDFEIDDGDKKKDLLQDVSVAYDDLRSIAKDLKMIDWQDLDLTQALIDKLEVLNKVSKVKFVFKSEMTDEFEFNQFEKMHLYAVISELITNILKHSNASNAFIEFKSLSSSIAQIRIYDDGVAVDNKNGGGIGLANIKERLKLVNAKLEIHTLTSNYNYSILLNRESVI